MAIRIKEINVRDLGPLKGDHHFPLDTFNLIYAKNERGKTFLVEFIIRCLFKAASKWHLREETGEGKISVVGLSEGEVIFTPAKRKKKLEDYLDESLPGLPPDLSKLLVVKGAELELVRGESGGVNRAVLKEFLSGEALLDEIEGRILATVLKATIEDGVIKGKDVGDIARRRESGEKLRELDEFVEEVDRLDSGGTRASLERKIGSVITSIEQMEKARRHTAYNLQNEIDKLTERKGDLTSALLNELREQAITHSGAKGRMERNVGEAADLEEASLKYHWLTEALSEYRQITANLKPRASKIFLLLTLGFLIVAVASLVAVLLDLTTPLLGIPISIGALLLMGGFGAYALLSQSRSEKAVFEDHEIQRINIEYREILGEEMPSIASMEALENELQEAAVAKQQLEKNIGEDRELLSTTEARLSSLLSKYEFDDPNLGWAEKINDLDDRLNTIHHQINLKREELAGLSVDPSDYEAEYSRAPFQKSTLDDLESQLLDLNKQLEEEKARFEAVRHRLSVVTGISDLTTPLEGLIQRLREKRHEQSVDYRERTADLISKILVKEELALIREQEDVKIQSGLDSEQQTRPLHEITGHYTTIELQEGQLVVSDPYESFAIDELSTGAQEQVLLALRIGCASHILGDKNLFLILDDAFQYADWDRREHLLDEVIRLGKKGWQILYLTMDDHIRDLFQKRGEKEFKKEFTIRDLEE